MIETLLRLNKEELSKEIQSPSRLRIYPKDKEKDLHGITVLWAPVDYVNKNADLVIIGVTPGTTQIKRSYDAIIASKFDEDKRDALVLKAKAESSFRDKVMEPNLKSILEHSGVAERA